MIVGKFDKVSENTFKLSGKSVDLYSEITIPTRGTKKSAGYDFIAYEDINIPVGETVLIPSGIKVRIEDGWFLGILPRSGHGFKFRLQLDNTMGVIDADYYDNPDNEGHIFVKLTNDGRTGKDILIQKGQGYCQGIFLPFGISEDDDASNNRSGGFGSTDTK